MMKNRILSIILILSLLIVSGGDIVNSNSANCATSKGNEKKKQYIVSIRDSDVFMEEKVKMSKKRVVRHTASDERYLEKNNNFVVEITEEEAAEYEKRDKIFIEEEQELSASGLTGFIGEEVPMNKYETEKEYSDDPYSFKPYKGNNQLKDGNDVVPWNISCVAGTPHENKYKGKNVKVAVIDSGVDTHDDLNTKGWVDFSDTVHGFKPTDNSGHGTAMAGVIAGSINGIGIEGIASEADIYSVKVLDKENTASVSSVVKAIQWCMDNDIDIINMSFGMDQYSEVLHQMVAKAYDKGILMIAAAGNDTNSVQYPAAYSEVISVGSVGEDLERSDFSYNKDVDVLAPGENVQTTGFVGSYMKTSGTSIAAAHVTGVAAAVKSARHKMKADQLKQILFDACLEIPDGGKLINYENAIYIEKQKEYKKNSLSSMKNKMKELADDENNYVKGSWSCDNWKGETKSGHYTMINNMELSYFSVGAANDTQKTYNRWIVAKAASKTDEIKQLSAKDSGNFPRNANGVVLNKDQGESCYSPYHAKSEYDMTEVLHHLRFLYELARRRLVLNQSLSLTATDYVGNSYYGATLEQKMKRRIIEDLKVLHGDLVDYYNGTAVNINTTAGKGYMVLGVMLHLAQDMEAHRAKVSLGMVFSSSSYKSYYTEDKFGASMGECRIKGNNILGNPSTGNSSYSHACMMLHVQLTNSTTMPIIRLKDYLKDDITIMYRNKIFDCDKASQAYEDNPYFAPYRFSVAELHSKSYINQMMADTGGNSNKLNYYFTNSTNPLYEATYGRVILK